MKKEIKQLLKKIPGVKRIRAFLKGGPERTVKKYIIGENNLFEIDETVVLVRNTFDVKGNDNTIEIKDFASLVNLKIYIRGNNNIIKIGRKVRFKNGGVIWIEDNNCEAVIGDQTTFEDAHIAVTEPNSKITIGKDCMFANDIDLRTGDSHSIIDTLSNERINYAKNISIGDHVWVAAHVTILKGANIGTNSVVATRAVVTRSFSENNILIGGIPAVKLKENISWDRRRIYK